MPSEDQTSWARRVSEALRAVRRRRGLRAAAVARAMGAPARSYARFEQGAPWIDLAALERFARAVDGDANAVLAAVLIGSPEFAARAADNRLASLLLIALRDFDADAGEAVGELDAAEILAAFDRAFAGLLESARRKTAARRAALADAPRLGARAGPPRSGRP